MVQKGKVRVNLISIYIPHSKIYFNQHENIIRVNLSRPHVNVKDDETSIILTKKGLDEWCKYYLARGEKHIRKR